jgi:signal transduction histidine kinase
LGEATAWRGLSSYYLHTKNYEKAIACIDSSLAVCNRNNFLHDKSKALSVKASVLYAMQRLKEGDEVLIESNEIQEQLIGDETQNRIVIAEKRFETEKKESQIQLQQAAIAKQGLQRKFLMAGVAVCIVILALSLYMLRLRNHRNRVLAEINNTKDKFFSIISHDLKNPAITQRDALQQLTKNATSWNVNTLTEHYHELLKSADAQVELLYNLLNWAQLQTGRMAYTPISFNLSAHLRSDIALIHKMAENKDITFSAEIPEDAIVTGDRNILVTVVRNLLTNAVKFTEKGGSVTLKIAPIGDVAKKDSAQYMVSVTDTGTGMSEEQIRHLFHLDSRQHSRRGTANEEGSGLGLIVCKELLEKHKSHLHIESEAGKGSKFEFTI